jgi:ElaB/YqjD/DUF883 family membrane-anchored ribosome-binding protein
MTARKPTEVSNNLADQAAQSADNAIRSTQQIANAALDQLANGVEDLHHRAAPLLNRATEQASAAAHRSMDAVRDSSHELRAKAQEAADTTVAYIKDEPVKAMLIAAATGAALMALVGLLGRSRDGR